RLCKNWRGGLRKADFSARRRGIDIDIGSRGYDFERFRIDRRPGRSRRGIVHGRRHEGDTRLDINAGADGPTSASTSGIATTPGPIYLLGPPNSSPSPKSTPLPTPQ